MTTEPNTAEEIATTFTIEFLKKDLNRLYDQSVIIAKKNNSTVRTVLAQHLLDNGFNGVHVKAHTAQTLDRLKEKVKDREDKLDEKISKLKLSANPNDWILANGIENVKMGVHSVIQLIEEVSDG